MPYISQFLEHVQLRYVICRYGKKKERLAR